MHSLADCPLRTFCCITTADQYPFHILHLDHAALDLFLNSPLVAASDGCSAGLNGEALHDSEYAALAQLRAKALQYLQGKSIIEILLPDPDFCLATTSAARDNTNGDKGYAIQSFVIAEEALEKCSSGDDDEARGTRRLHGCVHYVSPYPSSPPLDLSAASAVSGPSTVSSTSPTSPTSTFHDPEQLQDHTSSSRVYVLKDVTEIFELALHARSDLYRSARSAPFTKSAQAASTVATPSLLTQSTSISPSSSSTDGGNSIVTPARIVTRQKLYCTDEDSDWLMTIVGSSLSRSSSSESMASTTSTSSPSPSLYSSPSACSSSSSLRVYPTISLPQERDILNSEDPGLLLLHVTHFGTVDHAFVVPQQRGQHSFFSQNDAFADALTMTNKSVMSYAHPDDVRTLCRGLDRICKSLRATFRIRWRVQQGRQRPSSTCGKHNQTTPTEMQQETELAGVASFPRVIEFQGESFEEWIDPTVAPDPSLASKTTDIDDDNDDESYKYIWTEVRGIQSNGQPMLVVRPLTEQEIQEQHEWASVSAGLVTRSQRSREGFELNSSKQDSSKEWKTKRMGLEEVMKLPKQSNISALTSLTATSHHHHYYCQEEVLSLKMPGSLPSTMYQSSLALSTASSMTCPRYGRSSNGNGVMSMPSMLAYPTTTPITPWVAFMTIALDAWKQWIQTVHAGQAQFQDWCEYVLEVTIDQLVEGVTLGISLLGVEDSPTGSAEDELKVDLAGQSMEARIDDHLHFGLEQQKHERQRCNKQSGIRRVGQMLHNYPSVEGVVLTFGNSWLGRKIKSRLEHKLVDLAAEQAVDWWYGSDDKGTTATVTTNSDMMDPAAISGVNSVVVSE
ncbi:hypothetical protein EDD21DRAFT_363378 [Dissophora ornata]|nr:hypothetical protein BGZ58_004649 [Dissophora ornata]KAI8605485.1 hypothetical protein EDD21DRAFT_363378 [Dissophora ornata]